MSLPLATAHVIAWMLWNNMHITTCELLRLLDFEQVLELLGLLELLDLLVLLVRFMLSDVELCKGCGLFKGVDMFDRFAASSLVVFE